MVKQVDDLNKAQAGSHKQQESQPENGHETANANENVNWHDIFKDNSPLANRMNRRQAEEVIKAGAVIYEDKLAREKKATPDTVFDAVDSQLNTAPVSVAVKDESPDTYAKALSREAELFASLPANAYQAGKNKLSNEPGKVALEAGAGLVIGAGMAAVTKNPGILGQTLAPYAKTGVRYLGRTMLALGALDWTIRIGAPALDTWQDKDSLEHNKARLGHNVGTGVVDYGAGIAGGAAGAKAAWRYTPEWINPKLQAKVVNDGVPVEAKSPEQYATQRETTMKDDVRALYEQTFSPEERQPTEDIMELVAQGKILIHTSRVAATGELKTMSFTGVHEQPSQTFNNLDFIATAESARSQGIGSLHAKRLTEIVGKEHPEATALTLEVDNPAKLTGEDQVAALAKAKFYNRLGFNDTTVDYNFLAFKDPSFKGPANWRAFVFKPEKFDPIEAARGMYTNEGGYGLKPTDKRVWSLEDANGYWSRVQNTWSHATNAATSAQAAKRAQQVGQEMAR